MTKTKKTFWHTFFVSLGLLLCAQTHVDLKKDCEHCRKLGKAAQWHMEKLC